MAKRVNKRENERKKPVKSVSDALNSVDVDEMSPEEEYIFENYNDSNEKKGKAKKPNSNSDLVDGDFDTEKLSEEELEKIAGEVVDDDVTKMEAARETLKKSVKNDDDDSVYVDETIIVLTTYMMNFFYYLETSVTQASQYYVNIVPFFSDPDDPVYKKYSQHMVDIYNKQQIVYDAELDPRILRDANMNSLFLELPTWLSEVVQVFQNFKFLEKGEQQKAKEELIGILRENLHETITDLEIKALASMLIYPDTYRKALKSYQRLQAQSKKSKIIT